MIYKIRIKPLTRLWTGDEKRKSEILRETGIIGSLRWWYEALIRGLDGTACDPTLKNKGKKCEGENHCDACELFGCSGWARKFKLEVEKTDDKVTFKIIELRRMDNIEFGLLNKTFKIIEEYGALGGKLAEKDYGLIKIEKNDLEKFQPKKKEIINYIKKRKRGVDDPNLKRFFFIKKGLNWQFVKELKRKCTFLKGRQNRGKRYFYKTLNSEPYRLFIYYTKDDEYPKLLSFLRKHEFIKGSEVLEALF